jgi:hypothetical protein
MIQKKQIQTAEEKKRRREVCGNHRSAQEKKCSGKSPHAVSPWGLRLYSSLFHATFRKYF